MAIFAEHNLIDDRCLSVSRDILTPKSSASDRRDYKYPAKLVASPASTTADHHNGTQQQQHHQPQHQQNTPYQRQCSNSNTTRSANKQDAASRLPGDTLHRGGHAPASLACHPAVKSSSATAENLLERRSNGGPIKSDASHRDCNWAPLFPTNNNLPSLYSKRALFTSHSSGGSDLISNSYVSSSKCAENNYRQNQRSASVGRLQSDRTSFTLAAADNSWTSQPSSKGTVRHELSSSSNSLASSSSASISSVFLRRQDYFENTHKSLEHLYGNDASSSSKGGPTGQRTSSCFNVNNGVSHQPEACAVRRKEILGTEAVSASCLDMASKVPTCTVKGGIDVAEQQQRQHPHSQQHQSIVLGQQQQQRRQQQQQQQQQHELTTGTCEQTKTSAFRPVQARTKSTARSSPNGNGWMMSLHTSASGSGATALAVDPGTITQRDRLANNPNPNLHPNHRDVEAVTGRHSLKLDRPLPLSASLSPWNLQATVDRLSDNSLASSTSTIETTMSRSGVGREYIGSNSIASQSNSLGKQQRLSEDSYKTVFDLCLSPRAMEGMLGKKEGNERLLGEKRRLKTRRQRSLERNKALGIKLSNGMDSSTALNLAGVVADSSSENSSDDSAEQRSKSKSSSKTTSTTSRRKHARSGRTLDKSREVTLEHASKSVLNQMDSVYDDGIKNKSADDSLSMLGTAKAPPPPSAPHHLVHQRCDMYLPSHQLRSSFADTHREQVAADLVTLPVPVVISNRPVSMDSALTVSCVQQQQQPPQQQPQQQQLLQKNYAFHPSALAVTARDAPSNPAKTAPLSAASTAKANNSEVTTARSSIDCSLTTMTNSLAPTSNLAKTADALKSPTVSYVSHFATVPRYYKEYALSTSSPSYSAGAFPSAVCFDNMPCSEYTARHDLTKSSGHSLLDKMHRRCYPDYYASQYSSDAAAAAAAAATAASTADGVLYPTITQQHFTQHPTFHLVPASHQYPDIQIYADVPAGQGQNVDSLTLVDAGYARRSSLISSSTQTDVANASDVTSTTDSKVCEVNFCSPRICSFYIHACIAMNNNYRYSLFCFKYFHSFISSA